MRKRRLLSNCSSVKLVKPGTFTVSHMFLRMDSDPAVTSIGHVLFARPRPDCRQPMFSRELPSLASAVLERREDLVFLFFFFSSPLSTSRHWLAVER